MAVPAARFFQWRCLCVAGVRHSEQTGGRLLSGTVIVLVAFKQRPVRNGIILLLFGHHNFLVFAFIFRAFTMHVSIIWHPRVNGFKPLCPARMLAAGSVVLRVEWAVYLVRRCKSCEAQRCGDRPSGSRKAGPEDYVPEASMRGAEE